MAAHRRAELLQGSVRRYDAMALQSVRILEARKNRGPRAGRRLLGAGAAHASAVREASGISGGAGRAVAVRSDHELLRAAAGYVLAAGAREDRFPDLRLDFAAAAVDAFRSAFAGPLPNLFARIIVAG